MDEIEIISSEENKIKAQSLSTLETGISSFLELGQDADDTTDISDLYDESQVVELVNGIITQSQRYRCSDIHIEL